MSKLGQKNYELTFKIAAQLGSNFEKGFSSAEGAVNKLKSAMNSANTTMKNVASYQKQEQALSKTKEKMAQLQSEAERLQAEMSQTEQPSAKLKAAMEKNAAAMEKTAVKIKQQESSLESLKGKLSSAGVSTNNLSSETEKLKRRYEELSSAQKKLNTINSAISSNQAAISSTKSELRSTATTAAIAGAAMYKAFIEPTASFEQQMSTVKAISGANEQSMQVLSQKAKEMGRTTAFTATEAGQAYEYMAMAGWKDQQMLAGISGVMDLAAASGEELGLVSDIVTDAMTAMGYSAEGSTNGINNVTRFVDILAAASSNSNTNVSMLGESFKYCAPLAGAYKMSLEDTALVLGLMANSGIKASQSGTAMRKILAELSSDIAITQSNGEDFIVTTTNADGSMRSLREIITDLRTAFNGLNEEQKKNINKDLSKSAEELGIDLYDTNNKLKSQAELYSEVMEAADGLTESGKVQQANALVGKTAMAGLLAVVNGSDADFNKLANAIDNCTGAAHQMAETKLDNFSGQVTLAKSALEGAGIAVGESLIPTLREGAEATAKYAEKFANWAEKNPETVKNVASLIAKLLAAKVAFLGIKLAVLDVKNAFLIGAKAVQLFKIAKLVSGAGTAASALSGAGTSAGIFAGALGALISPAGLAVAAIGGVGLAAYGIKKAYDKAENDTIHFSDSMVSAVKEYQKVIEDTNSTQKLIDEYRKLEDVVSDQASGADKVAQAKQRMKDIEDTLIEQNPDVLSKYDKENGKISENLSLLEKKNEKEKEIAKRKAEQEVQDAKDKLPDAKNAINKYQGQYADAYSNYEQARKTQVALQGVAEKWDYVEQRFKEGKISLSERKVQMDALVDVAKVINNNENLGYNFDNISQVIGAYDRATSGCKKYVTQMDTANTKINETTDSIQAYYDQSKQLAEIDLGMTFETAVSKITAMHNELSKLESSGQGSSARAQELKNSLAELEPKAVAAGEKIDALGNSVRSVPNVKTIDVSQAISNCQSLKNTIDLIPTQKTVTINVRTTHFEETIKKVTTQVSDPVMNYGSYATGVKHYATGGIITQPTLATFAEEGPEAAIPLDGSGRAKMLWLKAGEMLGMTSAIQVNTPNKIENASSVNTSSTSNEIILKPTYIIQGNGGDMEEQFEKNNKRLLNELQERLERKKRLSYT